MAIPFDPYDFELLHLDNGIRLFLKHLPYASRVCMSFIIGVGGRDGKPGISHFTEHMICKKTKRFSSKQASDAYLRNGGVKPAGLNTSCLRTEIETIAPIGRERRALGVMTQFVMHPVFLGNIFEKEKRVIINECARSVKTKDAIQKQYAVLSEVYGENSPLVKRESTVVTLGDFADIEVLTLDDIDDHHLMYYNPGNMAVFVVGNFNRGNVFSGLTELSGLGYFPTARKNILSASDLNFASRRVERTDVELAGVCMSYSVIELVSVLPTGAMSEKCAYFLSSVLRDKLFLATRGKFGNTYSPAVSFRAYDDYRKISISIQTTGEPGVIEKSIIDSLNLSGSDEHFFEKAKKAYLADTTFNESPAKILSVATDDYVLNGRVVTLREEKRSAADVSFEDLVRAAEMVKSLSAIMVVRKT